MSFLYFIYIQTNFSMAAATAAVTIIQITI